MSIGFQIRQLIKQAVQNVVLPVCYQFFRAQSVDPKLVVFADAHHSDRPAAMELLFRKLVKSGEFRIVEHYLDYGEAGALEVARHSVSFMKLYARAGCVVICDNFLPAASCQKRRETKVIQLWHACGCYKRFGYDAPDDIPENYHGANVYRNADLVTVSGKAAVKAFASAMRLPERCVKPLGVSRTDLYFNRKWQERCRERFCERYPGSMHSDAFSADEGRRQKGMAQTDLIPHTEDASHGRVMNTAAGRKKIVLWAPTFRGNAGVPELISLDLARLQAELGDEYLVLARLHPHMQRMLKASSLKIEQFLCDIPTEELYPVVDVLIADYSSLVYEYLLFRKPVVMYVPDLEEYRSRRGFYMQIEEIPGRIVIREEELADAVRAAAVSQKEAAGSISRGEYSEDSNRPDEFLGSYMGACDGHATERIVKWMRENMVN